MLFILKNSDLPGLMLSCVYITLVLGKLCHAKQWPTPTSPHTPVIISLSIAKRDEYSCHAKQWPTPTSHAVQLLKEEQLD
jgi:hypothetical protein